MSTEHTDALPPGARIERRASAAHRDGRATAQAGEARRNPWSGISPDARERVLSAMWARGFSAGNTMQVTDDAGELIGTHGEYPDE